MSIHHQDDETRVRYKTSWRSLFWLLAVTTLIRCVFLVATRDNLERDPDAYGKLAGNVLKGIPWVVPIQGCQEVLLEFTSIIGGLHKGSPWWIWRLEGDKSKNLRHHSSHFLRNEDALLSRVRWTRFRSGGNWLVPGGKPIGIASFPGV